LLCFLLLCHKIFEYLAAWGMLKKRQDDKDLRIVSFLLRKFGLGQEGDGCPVRQQTTSPRSRCTLIPSPCSRCSSLGY
jgi:hypothetical protein